MALINYTESFNCLVAQGKGGKVLILRHLDSPFKRFDGKRVSYEIEYRDLSTTCESETDQSWACCVYQEFTYWSKKELNAQGIFKGLKNDNLDLFNSFTLL